MKLLKSGRRSHLVLCLLVIAGTYQYLYSRHVVIVVRTLTSAVQVPFTYVGAGRVASVTKAAADAAIHVGDVIEEIEGKPFQSQRTLDKVFQEARPDTLLPIVIRRQDGTRQHTAVRLLPLRGRPAGLRTWAFSVVSYIAVPLFCLLLGFGLVASRPSDPVAWLLFALLLSFAALNPLPGWHGLFYDAALLYQDFHLGTVGIWLLLFGIYFPGRVGWDVRRPWLKWCFIVPTSIVIGLSAVLNALNRVNFGLAGRFQVFGDSLNRGTLGFTVIATALFFVNLGLNSQKELSSDARRRLKILWVSTLISLGPILGLVLISLIRGAAVFDVPAWIAFSAVLLLALFPASLVHVIAVHRALEVRVMLRQGIKSILTARGLTLLRLIAVVAAFGVILSYASGPAQTPGQLVRVIFGSGILIFLVQLPFAEQLGPWLDRRLFRKEYHSEQLLLNLRTDKYSELTPLLRGLSHRLSRALGVREILVLLKAGEAYRVAHSTDVLALGGELSLGDATLSHLRRLNRPTVIHFDHPRNWTNRLPAEDRARLKELNSQVLLPLVWNQELLGVISLGQKASEEPYSKGDLQTLHSVATQTSLAVENSYLLARLGAEATERERQHAEKRSAEEANQAKSAFLARMSHELRTPLNAIIGYSEMLQEDATDLQMEGFVEDLEKIRSAGKHLLELINSILDISKIEAGKMELYIETAALPDLITGVVSIVRPVLDKNGNTFQLEMDDDLGTMLVDVTKLRQALFNLLSNASKFTDKGTITLAVQRRQIDGMAWMEFRISDTGIGMTSQQLSGLFQAFTQADASVTRKYGGTGLGLAITKRFCELMGGDVKAHSEHGKGSTFTITLPIQPQEQVSKSSAEMKLHDSLPEDARTVLIIDDDAAVHDFMRRSLAKHGIRALTANNGSEGLRMAHELRPDLITLDVLMAGIDGWQVLAELKADPDLSHIPIVMLTVVDDKKKGYSLGATDYLVKPVDRTRLMSVLSKLNVGGGLARATSAQALVIDDDPDARRILRRILESESWKVSEAEHGHHALEQLRHTVPQLILLDLIMPEMDGFLFLAELRDRPEWRDIPVIIVTAKDLTEEEGQRLNADVNYVMKKRSDNLDEVLAGISTHLRNACALEVTT